MRRSREVVGGQGTRDVSPWSKVPSKRGSCPKTPLSGGVGRGRRPFNGKIRRIESDPICNRWVSEDP